METSGFCREMEKKGKTRRLLAGFGVGKRKLNVSGSSIGWEVRQRLGNSRDPLHTRTGSGDTWGPPWPSSTWQGSGHVGLLQWDLGSHWGLPGVLGWQWQQTPTLLGVTAPTAMAASWASPHPFAPCFLPRLPLLQLLVPAQQLGAYPHFAGRKISPNHIIPRSRTPRPHRIFTDLWRKHQGRQWDRGLGWQRCTGLGWTPDPDQGWGSPGGSEEQSPGWGEQNPSPWPQWGAGPQGSLGHPGQAGTVQP